MYSAGIAQTNKSFFLAECRYRKSLDDLQKNSDKKVALLTDATKKAEAVVCIIITLILFSLRG